MRIPSLRLILIAFGLMFLGTYPGALIAEEGLNNINMILGDVQNVKVNGLTRVSVTDPDTADIADAKENEVSIVARKMGHTVLFVWDSTGKKTYSINVASDDLERLKSRLDSLLSEAGITSLRVDANYVEGKVVLSGNVNKDQKARLEKVLSPFEEQVINLAKEDEAQELIQIDMQIVEMSSTLDKNLGMTWSGSDGEGPLKFVYNESLSKNLKGSKDWLKIGTFNRSNPMVNTINLLINEGKARTLSRPRIVVTSGKEASVNVGGEVPIQSTTANSASQTFQSNVTFKQYGLTVTVTPTIKEGRIDISLNLQVSDIDSATPITSSNGSNVAYKTRTAQTQLMLDDKQTVLLAGLIRYTDGEQQKRVPFLGKMPIIGMLFRNTYKQAPDESKELVITLTPVILRHKKMATEQVKMPTKQMNDFVDEAERLNNFRREQVDPDYTSIKDVVVPQEPTEKVAPSKIRREVVPAAVKPRVIINERAADPLTPEPIATVQKYMQDIQVKISQNISYPYEALKNKWQGTVKLRLHILKDGTLVSANVVQSSGKQAFDDDAQNAAKIAAPYAAFSKDMQASDLNVTIPIVYQAK